MPAAIPLIISMGVKYFVTNALLATAIGALAQVVVGSAQARRAEKKAAAAARAAQIASLTDQKTVIRSAIQPQTTVYGRALVGGVIPFWFTGGDVGQYHHWAQVLAGHSIDGVDAIYVGEDLVTLDAAGWVTTAKYCRGGTVPMIRVRVYTGTQTSLDTELLAASAGALVSTDCGQGMAYLYVTWEADYDVFGQTGAPTIRAVVRGKKLYDPRTGLTVWSDNAALAARDYLTSHLGLRCTSGEVDDADVIAAANVCDEAVATGASTTQARYTANGVISCSNNQRDNLELLVDAMAGLAVWTQGRWSLQVGAYQVPVATIGVDDVITVEEVIAYTPRRECFNSVTGTFVDPATLYTERQYPVVTNATYVAQDSGQTIERNLQLPLCNDATRAQRMAKIEMERARQAVTVSMLCKWTAYDLRVGSHVSVQIPRYGWTPKVMFVATRTLRADGVHYVLRETAPEVWDWAYGEATVVDPAPNTSLPNPYAVQPLLGLSATSGTDVLQVAGDGTVISRIRVAWTATTDAYVRNGGRVEVRYRPQGTTDWATARADGDLTTLDVGPVEDGQVYDVQARAVNTTGQRGAWATITHTVVGKTEPPPQFDAFLVMVQPDGTRQFNFAYTTTARPLDWEGAEIRYLRGTVASPVWEAMTPLNSDQTHYTVSPVETNQLLAGDHTFACRSRDTSGNLSTARVVTITLPDRRLGNIAGEWDEDALGWPGTVAGGWINTLQNEIEATDTTTWDSLTTWDAWTRWNTNPATLVYTAPVRDLGVSVRGLLSVDLDAQGTSTLELRTSPDNVTWSAWGDASVAFTARYIQMRVSLAPGGTVPLLRELGYRVSAEVMHEALNDLVLSTLGANYLGTGDCRVPLANTYGLITRVQAVVQDGTGGAWTWHLVDKATTGPRVQFRRDGTLANPQFVDFYVEGY